jgi:hypothetical protein
VRVAELMFMFDERTFCTASSRGTTSPRRICCTSAEVRHLMKWPRAWRRRCCSRGGITVVVSRGKVDAGGSHEAFKLRAITLV